MMFLPSGCQPGTTAISAHRPAGVYPPAPAATRVVALGTLRGGRPPTRAQVELSQFLFGTEPPPPLTIVNPLALVASGHAAWIVDAALGAVLHLDLPSGKLLDDQVIVTDGGPLAVDVTPAGERFVVTAAAVHRFDPQGRPLTRYTLDSSPAGARGSDSAFRPGGVAVIHDTLWVSNVAQHRIELFEIATGRHLRSLGRRGQAAGEFGIPRSIARTPDGEVCIVDVLNNRVQVFDSTGQWRRSIGQAGDAVGAFGRPRDVAVGTDGTTFVADAFSQRIHAFSPSGEPLLAFGEPGSGLGALSLPSAVAVTTIVPAAEKAVPGGYRPLYYVLVAEQLLNPGIRVYAWLGAEVLASDAGLDSRLAAARRPLETRWTATNPHWRGDQCGVCHEGTPGRWRPIPPARTDSLCLACHDGVQASADPHPIGRPAVTELVRTPAGWPTIEGAIGCLTCHEMDRHCDANTRRPAANHDFLRGFDPRQPLAYCTNCHLDEVGGRFSPHRQADPTGRMRMDMCLFCHTTSLEIPSDGRRRFEPHLRAESSDLCLNCHTRHWDLSPLGHVDRPVTPEIRAHMLRMETISGPGRGDRGHDEPALLPLGDGNVTCFTCHNPHDPGMFPPSTELGALAGDPRDRRAALRTNWIELCSQCHHR